MSKDRLPDKDFDSVQRRRRTKPSSTDKRVTPQPRDLLWFQKLMEHGPLSSSYLHAFSKQIGRSEKRAKERLTDLFNESNTPHGGPYLTRPMQQFRTIDSRYNQLTYDLAPASRTALDETGVQSKDAGRSGPWLHSYMVSCITGSIELATTQSDNVRFIAGNQILDRANTSLRYTTKIAGKKGEQPKKCDLIPDALFGLEYAQGDQRFYRFFVIEADRGTEPATSGNFARKSYQRSILQYQQYVGQGLYKSHLNLTAPLIVLNVFNDPKKRGKMKSLTAKMSGGQGCPYMLFGTIEGFAECFKPQDPQLHLFKEPWERAKLNDFSINSV